MKSEKANQLAKRLGAKIVEHDIVHDKIWFSIGPKAFCLPAKVAEYINKSIDLQEQGLAMLKDQAVLLKEQACLIETLALSIEETGFDFQKGPLDLSNMSFSGK